MITVNVCPGGLWSWLRLMSPLFLPLPAIISSVESERTSLRVTDRGERWAEEGGGGAPGSWNGFFYLCLPCLYSCDNQADTFMYAYSASRFDQYSFL